MPTHGRARRPRIIIVEDDETGPAVYLLAAGNETWRVYDSIGPQPGRKGVLTPPHPQACYRWFVSEAGERRCHAFWPKDRHDLEPRLLSAQLTGSRRV